MKSLFLALIATITTASAGLNIPRSVHSIDEIEKAQAEAKEKSKPIAFLYTDPNPN